MPRYRLDIAYDGTSYHGWQRQSGVRSVQEAVEEAILSFAGPDGSGARREDAGARTDPAGPRLHAAGRTDAGVHASGQVAHVDLAREWEPRTVARALNAALQRAGEAVAIERAARVADDFHARFSAVARHYRYTILDRDWPPTLERHAVWWVPRRRPLDVRAMAEAARRLTGRHDFTTFRAAACQADSPVRTLDRLEVARERAGPAWGTHARGPSSDGEENGSEREGLVVIRASARSFLHHQVRSMTGALKRVGEERWTADDVEHALRARDRALCPGMAPPSGLCLVGVDYPGEGPTGRAEEGGGRALSAGTREAESERDPR